MTKKLEEPDVEIIGDDPEEDKSLPSSVTVDLDKPEIEVKKEEKVVEKPPFDERKLHNAVGFQVRQQIKALKEELKAEIRALRETNPAKAEVVQDQLDDIDRVAQSDWKAGVKKLVEPEIEARVQKAFQEREQKEVEAQRRYAVESELDKSKQKVIQKYPKIEEDGSEENTLYLEVINEDSSLLRNTHGPEIAMYRMEEKMRQMGRVPPSVKPVVDKEVNRLVRAGASSVVGRTASPNGKITLTKEQKEFCDHHGLPYDRYAKNLKAQDARGGIEA